MELSIYPVDHIGIAVNNIDASAEFYNNLFGVTISHRENVADQHIEVAFIQLPNIKIELISAMNSEGPVHRFIEKRGEGLHHICYKVPDVQAMLNHCEKNGMTLIDKSPRKGAYGKLIAFVHPKSCSGVLVEFCQ